MVVKRVAAALAGAALLASPGAAAGLEEAGTTRSGLFAGATLRVGLGRDCPKPAARLSLGHHRLTDGAFHYVRPTGLELGLNRTGTAQLSLAGQNMSDLQRRLNLNRDSTTTWLLVGGAVALVVAAAVLLSDDDEACCLDPNLCEPCDD